MDCLLYKSRDDDLMQVFAQKVCVDYVFGGDCDGLIYYADVKKRISPVSYTHLDVYKRQILFHTTAL